MIAFSYHEKYNHYDLGQNHPLIGDKPRKTLAFFKEKKLTNEFNIFQPVKASENDLLKIHSKEFVEKIKQLSKEGGYLSIDTPAPKGIYDVARLAVGGSLLAGKKLFKGYKIAVNPLGGFHHAGVNHSSGFCFFNDIAIATEVLKEKYDVKRVAIIDLDVHHANGTQEIFYKRNDVLLISFHQDGRTLYPGTGFINETGEKEGEGYTINMPFPIGAGDESYHYAFLEIVPEIVKQFAPQLIIYQSGVDTHHSDPLANILLTYPTYHFFAKEIKKLSEETCKKLLVLFGGGYNSRASIYAYYNIMCGLMNKNDTIKEEKLRDTRLNETKNVVEELKQIISRYWEI
ncbi:MAG TPA: histone deacetylase family protein [Thermoplasmatales archaeon]|nr:histone deacetylase family protein [Thermoplasmatales archaeon]